MTFAVDQYASTVSPVRWDDLDLSTFADRPLSAGALRTLRYMSDVETHTVCYLRDLLVTPAHADPEVTVFLTMWNYEEYWHGEVLDEVLRAHGVPTGPEHTMALRARLGLRDRLAPVRQSLLANVIGDDFVATHMTWGAINEWCTHSAYATFMAKERHPVLNEILGRIARQETRHIAFYNSQARARLARSRRAQQITRAALRHFWRPVGAGVMPREEVRHLLTFLMGGPEGRPVARRIDQKIDSLPGLAGLHLAESALERYGVAA